MCSRSHPWQRAGLGTCYFFDEDVTDSPWTSPGPDSARGRIAVIGDLHSAWDDADAAYFNQSAYDLLLFAGDLGATARRDGMRIAGSLAKLTRPALIMPRNNDADQFAALSAELAFRRDQAALMRKIMPESHASRGAGGVRFGEERMFRSGFYSRGVPGHQRAQAHGGRVAPRAHRGETAQGTTPGLSR